MSAGSAGIRRARAHGSRAARSPQVEWLARAGLFARGVVYAVIGVLAVKVALGDGGKATNQQGALKTIAGQPLGKLLLVLLAIGLAGYAIWRLVRAAVGHGVETLEDDDAKERISGAFSGVAYALLCLTAIKILAGSSGGGGDPGKATGGVLGWPAGQVLVAIAGLVLVGVGFENARRAVKKSFCEKAKTHEMSGGMRKAYELVGVVGHGARAIVFALMGYFLVKAAVEYDPKEAIGLDGALAKLAHASYGPLLLGITAAGLVAFALYSVLDARYRRV
jgi:hypothetical protein